MPDAVVDGTAEHDADAATDSPSTHDADSGADVVTVKDTGTDADASTPDADATVGDARPEIDGDATVVDTYAPDANAALDAGPDQSAMLAFPVQVATALCQQLLGCCFPDGGTDGSFDLNACVADNTPTGYANSNVGQDLLRGGNVAFDAATAQACLADLNGLGCTLTTGTQQSAVTDCFGAFSGTLEAGARCQGSIECGSGMFCDPADGGDGGTCTGLRTAGQPCGDFGMTTGSEVIASAQICSYRGSGNTGLTCVAQDPNTGELLPSWVCGTQYALGAGCNWNVDCASELCDPGAYACSSGYPLIYPASCGTYAVVDAGGD
jgi:hypothetical protein